MPDQSRPRSSGKPLAQQYDVALLDLDGVVYVGPHAVAGAVAALAQARDVGMRLAFVTNNAARTASTVADHLSDLGVPAVASDVTTSSQAAAHYLAERLPTGAKVLAVGAEGLTAALLERGLRPVQSADENPEAVVQGYSPDTNWEMLAEATVAVLGGALWVATNLDATLPSPRGPLPGNGSLVAAVATATGQRPVATGKPDPTMHRETLERSGANHPLVVGDRLDTDIAGAVAVGCASLLVLSGVTTPKSLLKASPDERPDYLGLDVSALLAAHPPVVRDGTEYSCGSWRAGGSWTGFTLRRVDDDAPATTEFIDDGLDPLRALCACVWSVNLPTDSPLEITAVAPEADRVLRDFGLLRTATEV
ncbi:HAD superfamily hydrolase (TIGR01450 family) [Jatrophihabitans sp. GAS493]|uniref:HAD-IIA family hydrolase n=1 Tax=Jatrophihabitans sp. GAS493 TaxID=1907575 RepID=UPI000BB861A5|nr:HAD-IIA family hydrolase [Jatrophihabitans sp. GAS493]SOD73788.1 HAD superfamily hydrolase (TIGR01450 family) [Jatrophihabitans sp. GAS493]